MIDVARKANEHIKQLVSGTADVRYYRNLNYRPIFAAGYNDPDCFLLWTFVEGAQFVKLRRLTKQEIIQFFTDPYDEYGGYSLGMKEVPDLLA